MPSNEPIAYPDSNASVHLCVIDAFSRWVELFPTTSVCAYETAVQLPVCFNLSLLQRYIRIEGLSFHNELIAELMRLVGTDHSLSKAYSKEENGIVERANQASDT